MKKIILSTAIAACIFITSCKKENLQNEPTKISANALQDGPSCEDCDILLPAPQDNQFGGNCDVGVGQWLMPDTYKYARFYIRYERNPNTGLLEVTSMYSNKNAGTANIIVTNTGTHSLINQSTGIITGTYSISIQHSPSWIVPSVFSVWIDTCNGVAIFTQQS